MYRYSPVDLAIFDCNKEFIYGSNPYWGFGGEAPEIFFDIYRGISSCFMSRQLNKCNSVSAKTLLQRFDLNHPPLLQCSALVSTEQVKKCKNSICHRRDLNPQPPHFEPTMLPLLYWS